MPSTQSTRSSAIPVRAFHLDLKGVPPTPGRLLRLLSIAAAGGFNAALVEWEDTFPWSVDPGMVGPSAYDAATVDAFHAEAKRVGIEIIPLVQTIGHLETPLSLPRFSHLREVPQASNVISPSTEGAGELIRAMVDDVLSRMKVPPRWFHLGGDEAWHLGAGEASKVFLAAHGGAKSALYLHHVEPLLDRLISRGIRPILWHDMMSTWEPDALKRIAAKADLMVWGYGEHPNATKHHYRREVIEKFAANGVPMWAGCAYKGGDGPGNDLPDLQKRLDNVQAWADIGREFGFLGAAATAWSRYTTHRIQGEPIDAALDALIATGQMLEANRAGDGKPARSPSSASSASSAASGSVAASVHSAASGSFASAEVPASPARSAIPVDVAKVRADALAVLDRIGERATFDACHAAMLEMSKARAGAWSEMRELREQVSLELREPSRTHSAMASEMLYHATRWTAGVERAGEALKKAMAELVQPASLASYALERSEPLRRQIDELTPIVAKLEPEGWRARREMLATQGIATIA